MRNLCAVQEGMVRKETESGRNSGDLTFEENVGQHKLEEYKYTNTITITNTNFQTRLGKSWSTESERIQNFVLEFLLFLWYIVKMLWIVSFIYVLNIWYFGSACLVFCISMQRCLVTLMDFRSRLSGDSLSVARHLQLQSCPSAFSSFLLSG